MKKTFFSFLLLAVSQLLSAQQPASADSVLETSAPAHILFEGVEVKGDIYDFAKALEDRGFQLKTRKGDSNYYIFKGSVCGNNCYFKVMYSKKTHTVASIVVEPKSVNINYFVDSLSVRYGACSGFDGEKYVWNLPNGGVMFRTPEGYDPILVVMDAEGAVRNKEER